jgi:hypothetical protein
VAMRKLLDHTGQRMVRIHFNVAVCADHQHRHCGQQRRQILSE